MRHHYINERDDEHYGVATNGDGGVLLQVGDERGQQVRILLTVDQALFLQKCLANSICLAVDEKVAASKSVNTPTRIYADD
jgi:hypothetical protein